MGTYQQVEVELWPNDVNREETGENGVAAMVTFFSNMPEENWLGAIESFESFLQDELPQTIDDRYEALDVHRVEEHIWAVFVGPSDSEDPVDFTVLAEVNQHLKEWAGREAFAFISAEKGEL